MKTLLIDWPMIPLTVVYLATKNMLNLINNKETNNLTRVVTVLLFFPIEILLFVWMFPFTVMAFFIALTISIMGIFGKIFEYLSN